MTWACAGGWSGGEPGGPGVVEIEPAVAESPGGPLPAWETEAERQRPGKADEWDDYRLAHPEWFGVTSPPVVAVRPFAEFEPAQAIMLRPSKSISKFHREIIKGAHGHVGRIVLFHLGGQKEGLTGQLKEMGVMDGSIEFLDVGEANANWTRDYGPLSVVAPGGEIGFVDFRYYHGRAYDDAIPAKLAAHWGINEFRPSMSYEGGNFMADEQGTCYATEKLYSQNGGYSKSQVTAWMEEYLGCRQMVIYKLPEHLGTGHVDMFSKLMDGRSVLLGYYDPAVRPVNAAILDENEAMLEAVVTQGGEKLTVHRLPLPWDESEVWYTYTNSLIVNDVVLIPVYGKFKDLEEEALAAYEAAAPGLERVTINSDAIIPAGGAIHCVTMTVPEGKLAQFQDGPAQLCQLNELKKCGGVTEPCGGLPLEGSCSEGSLSYCGGDGYPHQADCDGCCRWLPEGLGGLGWYDCSVGESCRSCEDECRAGESGCSALGSHRWQCGEAEADGCRRRQWTGCAMSEQCQVHSHKCEVPVALCPGGLCPQECGQVDSEGRCEGDLLLRCVEGKLAVENCAKQALVCGPVPELSGALGCWSGCDDLCEPAGARGCGGEGTLICAPDEFGCLSLAVGAVCAPAQSCFDGVCLDLANGGAADDLSGQPDESGEGEVSLPSGGCSAAPGAGGPCRGGAAAVLLLLALALAAFSVRLSGSSQAK